MSLLQLIGLWILVMISCPLLIYLCIRMATVGYLLGKKSVKENHERNTHE